MKILVVSSNPLEVTNSAMISTRGLLKGLIKLDHEVTYLTFKPYEHMRDKMKSNDEISRLKVIQITPNKTYQKLIADQSKVSSFNKFKSVVLSILRSIYHKVSLYDNYKSAIQNVDEIQFNEQFDLIISCSDPKSSHLLAKRIIDNNKDKFKVWVQHWGDPMLIDITKKTILPKFLVKKHEKYILEKADRVVYVSPLTLEAQKKLYPSINKRFYFIPLPYQQKVEIKNKKLANKKVVSIGYFGNYNIKIRDIRPLYEAVKGMENINLKIVGDSNISLEEIDNIEVHGRIDHISVQEFEKSTDILIVICNKRGTQIPGKVFYYASTNKPILVIMDGAVNQLKSFLEKYDRYYFCENNPISIKESIKQIIKESDYKSFSPIEEFESTNVAKKIIEISK